MSECWNLYDYYETQCEWVCQKCITSFPYPWYFAIPHMNGFSWKLLHQTPDTVQDLPELKLWFNDIMQKLCYKDKKQLCNWLSQYVELAVLLLCHTFHMDKVQCFFLEDNLISENPNDPIDDEQLIHVEKGVTTLLGIMYQNNHFAVVKVHLNNQKVSVWDSGIDQQYLDCAEILWFNHIVCLLCVH